MQSYTEMTGVIGRGIVDARAHFTDQTVITVKFDKPVDHETAMAALNDAISKKGPDHDQV